MVQVLLRCRWAAGVRFPQATVARIGAGVASALAYMHEHCICHGALPSWRDAVVLQPHPQNLTQSSGYS